MELGLRVWIYGRLERRMWNGGQKRCGRGNRKECRDFVHDHSHRAPQRRPSPPYLVTWTIPFLSLGNRCTLHIIVFSIRKVSNYFSSTSSSQKLCDSAKLSNGPYVITLIALPDHTRSGRCGHRSTKTAFLVLAVICIVSRAPIRSARRLGWQDHCRLARLRYLL